MAKPAPDAELVRGVLRAQGLLDDDDVVYLGGSVADGLATPWSDVDVFVVRDVDRAAGDGVHLVPMPHDQLPMDLEVWSRVEVDSLLTKLQDVDEDSATNHRAFMRVSDEERDFLHSLASALPVHNEERLRALQARLDPSALARVSLARALVGIYNAQTDLLGWLACDWQSVGTACQRLVDFSALAMLAATGCTHPGGKWVLPLVRDRFHDVPLPPRLLGGAASLADRLYELQRKPARPEDVDAYARASVDFSNRAVIYAQTIGVEDLDRSLHEILWMAAEPALSTNEWCPALSCGWQVRFDAGEWYLLHVGREMYSVNPAAVGMVMLIDGRTTERGILDRVSSVSPADRRQLERSLRDLLMFLGNANLLAA